MSLKRDHYRASPEALVVRLASRGDQTAFEELVHRRQSWIRNLMRRLCRDAALADDLAQLVFLQMWRTIAQVQQPAAFPGWLKRTAINTWLQHARRNDPLWKAGGDDEIPEGRTASGSSLALDLDHALATLPDAVRLCIVLSYHERMSHAEIAESSGLPLGTVKSHIRRGTEQLRLMLADYSEQGRSEVSS